MLLFLQECSYILLQIVPFQVTNGNISYYSTVAVRVILFIKNIPAVNEVFVINDLAKGSTKAFERNIYDLKPNEELDDVTRYEIFTDNCY